MEPEGVTKHAKEAAAVVVVCCVLYVVAVLVAFVLNVMTDSP